MKRPWASTGNSWPPRWWSGFRRGAGPGRPDRPVTVHLQANFALNQPLSPFALAALELLDPESPSYALDVVSVIEATLEKPRQILSAQQKKARGEAIAAMKADGIEYDQRMAMLEEVTYPQPLAELLGEAFEVYRKAAPWVGDFELAPKSVVRDMYERAMNFGEFVQFYGLARSEGIVLRYLADCFKALRQTVPQDLLREDLEDLIAWLGELVRQVDSSLLDEWEELTSGAAPTPHDAPPPPPPSLTSNIRAFRVMVRNEMFRRVELFADEDAAALGELDGRLPAGMPPGGKTSWTTISTNTTTSAPGRTPAAPGLLIITEEPGLWKVRQIFDDPAATTTGVFPPRWTWRPRTKAGPPVVQVTDVNRL